MKFTLLTLLGVTGYFALVVSAFGYPASPWSFVALFSWFAFLIVLCASACEGASAGAKSARASLLVTVLYLFVATQCAPPTYALPHEFFTRWLLELHLPPQLKTVADPNVDFLVDRVNAEYSEPGFVRRDMLIDELIGDRKSNYLGSPAVRIEQLSLYNTALFFGLLAGTLASWRVQRDERRSARNAPQSLPAH
jgi:hypothetical protein